MIQNAIYLRSENAYMFGIYSKSCERDRISPLRRFWTSYQRFFWKRSAWGLRNEPLRLKSRPKSDPQRSIFCDRNNNNNATEHICQ